MKENLSVLPTVLGFEGFGVEGSILGLRMIVMVSDTPEPLSLEVHG